MRYSVDTTKPVQLYPNTPGGRGEYAVPGRDGYLHVVTASVYRHDLEWGPAGTLNVHIGCSVLITDMVREDETEWQAIERVVTTWQAEQLEADHAEVLTMVAETAEPLPVRVPGATLA